MWMKREVSRFCNLVVQPKDCKNPLEWWKTNEKLFPIVIFLAMQNFRILGAKEKHNNSFLLEEYKTSWASYGNQEPWPFDFLIQELAQQP